MNDYISRTKIVVKIYLNMPIKMQTRQSELHTVFPRIVSALEQFPQFYVLSPKVTVHKAKLKKEQFPQKLFAEIRQSVFIVLGMYNFGFSSLLFLLQIGDEMPFSKGVSESRLQRHEILKNSSCIPFRNSSMAYVM